MLLSQMKTNIKSLSISRFIMKSKVMIINGSPAELNFILVSFLVKQEVLFWLPFISVEQRYQEVILFYLLPNLDIVSQQKLQNFSLL